MLHASSPITPRLLHTVARFGLTLSSEHPALPPSYITAARALASRATPGTITLIAGPSGSGKSSLLNQIANAAAHTHTILHTAHHLRTCAFATDSLIDTLCDSIATPTNPSLTEGAALSLLSAVGLADANLIPRAPAHLSEGQRARFALALTLAQAATAPPTTPTLILADEFTSPLDRTTARTLCAVLRRRFTTPTQTPNTSPLSNFIHPHTALIVATAHAESIKDPLAPNTTATLTLQHTCTITP